MQITAQMVKALREKTSAGVMDCRNALAKSEGDMDKAVMLLREQGFARLAKREGHDVSNGVIETYIHGTGRVGGMIEVNCETDFVAKTPEFKALAHNLVLQIVATDPRFISSNQIPEGTAAHPAEVCILEQKFIKDESKTIRDIIAETAAKVGENILVGRFARFEVGKQANSETETE